ncbi:MAG: aromatic ring-hydroxylating dioxygenase subunit alpha [Pseudomonadota bacterium]
MTIRYVNHTDREHAITNVGKQRYLTGTQLDAEWDAVWRKSWLIAGLAEDVANAGDFFVFDIAREQILVTRTGAGDVRAYYNVCQHRGNLLVTEERGTAANFRCAYHAWTYDLEGQLSAVPYKERFVDRTPGCEQALQTVHVEIWKGIVFVNLDADPMPLARYLTAELTTLLEPYRFEKMTLAEDQTVRLECNWKAVVDNFSELYHVDFLHPQHRRMVDCCNDTVHLFENGHTGLEVPGATFNPRFPVPAEPTDIHTAQLKAWGLDPADFVGRVPDIRRAIQVRRREVGRDMGFDFDAFSDAQLSDVWQFNFFPNCMLTFTPGHLWILRVRPDVHDPERCQLDKLSLTMFADPEVAGDAVRDAGGGGSRSHFIVDGVKPADWQRPERDVFDYDAVIAGDKTMTDTIDQDVELLGNVQRGMRSAGFSRTWLNDDEMRVQHFHNEIDRLIESGG